MELIKLIKFILENWLILANIGLAIGLHIYFKKKKEKEERIVKEYRAHLTQLKKKEQYELENEEEKKIREEIIRKHTKETEKENEEIDKLYQRTYEPKYLMSINEKNQFKKIYLWAQSREYLVFTKIRLQDLITPRNNAKHNKKVFWKIQAKHVDFVICDKNIKVKAIIEILDNSHTDPERMERDKFVRTILQACGYKYIETYNITEEELNKIS